MNELTRLKHLVPAIVFAPEPPDLAGVKIARGDYHEGQLAERMNTDKLVGDVVTHWHRHAQGRATVVFASGVKHSVHLKDELCRSGVIAEPFDLATALRGLPRWNGRGGRRELERGVVAAQRAGYIEQLANGRYRVTTKDLMTGTEYRADYPDAVWAPGISWVNTP